jgi:hypothetical protein
VLNNLFNLLSSPSYSAVYFTTPVLIAPLETVNIIVTKFVNCPINATPEGPVKIATILFATKPEIIRMNVDIAEYKDVLINFKMRNS